MIVTLELPPEIEAGLLAQAHAEGIDVANYVRNLVQKEFATAKGMGQASVTNERAPEEWMRAFRAWAHSHDHANLPVLSDSAVSRDSMYDEPPVGTVILADTNILLRSLETSAPHYPIVENALAKLRSRQEVLCVASAPERGGILAGSHAARE